MRALAGFAVLPICLALGFPAAADEDACKRRIGVTGRAEASLAPDYIALTLTTESKAPNVAGALEASAKSIAEFGAFARELGLPENAVRTSSVVLEDSTRTVSRTIGADQHEPDGFRVGIRVSLRLADRSRVGDLVRRVLDKGKIRVEFVELGLDDPDKAENALLAAAGKDARAQANALAEAAGTNVGAVCSLKAGGMQQSPQPSLSRPASRLKKSSDYEGYSDSGGKPGLYIPLESGTIDLAVEVSAEFAAQP